jgi:hypothetical protein
MVDLSLIISQITVVNQVTAVRRETCPLLHGRFEQIFPFNYRKNASMQLALDHMYRLLTIAQTFGEARRILQIMTTLCFNCPVKLHADVWMIYAHPEIHVLIDCVVEIGQDTICHGLPSRHANPSVLLFELAKLVAPLPFVVLEPSLSNLGDQPLYLCFMQKHVKRPKLYRPHGHVKRLACLE